MDKNLIFDGNDGLRMFVNPAPKSAGFIFLCVIAIAIGAPCLLRQWVLSGRRSMDVFLTDWWKNTLPWILNGGSMPRHSVVCAEIYAAKHRNEGRKN